MSERSGSETSTYKPKKNVERTMDEAQQAFEETFGRPFFPVAYSRRPEVRPWTPPTEVIERDGSYTLRMDVPGAQTDSIDISATDDSISVSGTLDASQQIQPSNYYLCEMCYGPFERTIYFRKQIDPDNVTATLQDGVLTLEVPEVSQARGKKIDIGAGQPAGQGRMQGGGQGQEQWRLQPSIKRDSDIDTALPGQTGEIEEEYYTAPAGRGAPNQPAQWRRHTPSMQEQRDVNTALPGQTGETDEEYTARGTGERTSTQGQAPGQRQVRTPGETPAQPPQQTPGRIRKYAPEAPALEQPLVQPPLSEVIAPVRRGASGRSAAESAAYPMMQRGTPEYREWELQQQENLKESQMSEETEREAYQWEQTGNPAMKGSDVHGELPGQTGDVGEMDRSGDVRQVTPEQGSQGGNRQGRSRSRQKS